MQNLLTSSATALANAIRDREISSETVVEAHLARIAAVNPALNAVVFEMADAARRMAKEADAAVERGDDLPPLHGVPCTIKECFAIPNTPQTSGVVARIGYRSDETATTVARLLEAGAIPLGKTNVSELCMWMEGNNRVYGRTNNPYDPRRIVGGSSSGEGAIVGAGGSPFGLGSDIGGSIRMPAFFNGVFGHKVTGGRVPNTGQYPEAHGASARYCCTGPIARRAEDLALLVSLMQGPDGKCGGARAMPFEDPRSVRIESLDVLVVEDDGRTYVHPELRKAQARAAKALEARGARVRKARIPGLEHSFDIWSSMLQSEDGDSFAALMAEGKAGGFRFGRELALWTVGQSDHTLPALILGGMESLTRGMKDRQAKMVALGEELRASLVREIGPNGVMLYPSHGMPAPLHYQPLLWPFFWVYTAILNVMELPVTQVPLGFAKSGAPLGVQVAAIHEQDHLSIAVALELERAFGGWTMPA
jgi:fatty acid amide hydrolase 2